MHALRRRQHRRHHFVVLGLDVHVALPVLPRAVTSARFIGASAVEEGGGGGGGEGDERVQGGHVSHDVIG